ncbi:MAG: IS110 family transposase [Prosthecochloris sp.]|uniref:IS110 family transposase n=2 Tax=unclassified Prosthecochloris TaxID=2632826 RepID=UPI0013C8936A|nr:IS110 family transposase [Prosthecochloris sp.]NEX11445.1 IS110 family transposase [Prosthecochloris sp.]
MKRQLQDNQEAFAGQEFFIGIDVHNKQWTVSVRSNHMALDKPVVVDPSAEKVAGFLRKRYPGGKYYAVYEAGYSGFWPARSLEESGIVTTVVNPADIPTMQKERSTKTDRVDSRKLARSLENGELKGIYIPDRLTEEYRQLARYRSRLVREQTRLKNRIKAVLSQFNYRCPLDLEGNRWSGAYLNWLSSVRFETSYAQMAYEEQLCQLQESRERLSRVLRELKRMTKEHESLGHLVKLLQTVPGIGFVTAVLLVTELVDMDRFKRLEDLASFVGLAPSVHQSDERSYSRGLTKRQHKELRSRLIESAWVAVRKDPVLTMKFGKLSQRMNKKKAIIRIAKKLLSRIRSVWQTQKPYVYGVIE